MEKTQSTDTDASTPGPDLMHRTFTAILTLVVSFATLATLFQVIDLDPDRLTMQLQDASSTQVGAWVAITFLTVFGVYRAVLYVVKAGLNAWVGFRSPIEPVLGAVTFALLMAVNLSGDVALWGPFAILAAMFTAFISEVMRSTPARLK